MEFDVGIAALMVLIMVQVSLVSIYLSVQSSSEMLVYAEEQRERIVFSDELMNRHGIYDLECRSIVPQTIGELPDKPKFNVSLRKPGEPSKAKGLVVRRLVFVGEVRRENERILEIW